MRRGEACAEIAPERRQKIGFHALRHTAASWMVQDGVPLYEVARILGHGSVYVTERYAHLVPGFAQGPIDKLGARLRPEDLPPVNSEPTRNGTSTRTPTTESAPITQSVLAASAASGADRSPSSTSVHDVGPRFGPRDEVADRSVPS